MLDVALAAITATAAIAGHTPALSMHDTRTVARIDASELATAFTERRPAIRVHALRRVGPHTITGCVHVNGDRIRASYRILVKLRAGDFAVYDSRLEARDE